MAFEPNPQKIATVVATDPATRTVQYVDWLGGKGTAIIPKNPNIAVYPSAGETWILENKYSSWVLMEQHLESNHALSIDGLKEGDMAIAASGRLAMQDEHGYFFDKEGKINPERL